MFAATVGLSVFVFVSRIVFVELSSKQSCCDSRSAACCMWFLLLPRSAPREIKYFLSDILITDRATMQWGNNVDLVLCVLLGHQNSKIANSMKLVNFALFSSQYHVFELKNIRGNLIAPNSNRWSLSNKIAMSQEDNRKIISLFGQEKSIFLHPWMLKDLM